MKLSEYAELDATELAALVRGGAVSPRELVETALTAIQRTDKEIHAVVDYTYMIVLPTNLKPSFFRPLLILSESAVLAGISVSVWN